jgi:oligoendopeptidase F
MEDALTINKAARLALGVSLAGAAASAEERATALKDRWDLSAIFKNADAYDAAKKTFVARLPALERYQGTLGTSAASLQAALEAYFAAQKDLARLFSYASMRSDQDTRVASALGVRQEAQQLSSDFGSRTAWLAPEVLALPEGTLQNFLAKEPGLAPYRFFLEELERQRAHTLSPAEEKLLAQAASIAGAPQAFHSILANADLPAPEVTLSDGTKARLDSAGYARYRAQPRREDRLLVFHEFWKSYEAFERTLGVALDAQARRDVFYARARKYSSSLAAAVDAAHIPETVYRTLVAEANHALPTLHRAFRLRGKLLGISELGYHDIYAPLVATVDLKFPIEKGKALALDALQPLGDDYLATVRKAFESRWMDVYPQPGKRSGAYSNGSVYDVHPFVLLNYNDDYEGVTTLAHEFGHAMHSYLANQSQPYPTADYPIFVAEVASTFNEALLLQKMLAEAKTDDERLFLLGTSLESLRGTFFRQAMFAEFELAIHEAVEKDEALTGEKLSKMYLELLRRYHGDDQGVVKIDDAYRVEWAYIPHFYYNFYVYQYATSIAASALLARDVIDGKPGARDRYLNLLRAGGSRHPYDMLKEAGVDLAAPAPYRALEQRMNWAMDEMEKILAKKAATLLGRPTLDSRTAQR